MTPKIQKIRYTSGYNYHIRFTDNREGVVDFTSFLWGDAFKQIKDKDFFKQAYIDKTAGTISWPNGADIAPETLYHKLES